MSDRFILPDYSSFSTIPNKFLRDERLSLKARGAMVTMLSLPPNWDFSLNGLIKILPDGKAAVQKSIRELEEYGYIVRQQTRDEKGRMGKSIYYIVPEPHLQEQGSDGQMQNILPQTENRLTVENVQMQKNSPWTENRLTAESVQNSMEPPQKQGILPWTGFPSTVFPSTENQPQLSILKNNRELNNTGVQRGRQDGRAREDIIKQQIKYSDISVSSPQEQIYLDAIVDTLVWVSMYGRPKINVRGVDYNTAEVKKKLEEIDAGKIEYVIELLMHYKQEIRSPRKFILSALLNSEAEAKLFYQNLVASDHASGII